MLDTLCNSTLIDTGSSDSERFVVIENFRNNLIHVNSQDTVIEWDRILADGWSDFRFEEDVNGGYWLTATQAIPEPATAPLPTRAGVRLRLNPRGRRALRDALSKTRCSTRPCR